MSNLRVGQRARHFMQRDRFVKLWLIPVWLGLGLASLVIVAVPFRHIAPRLGRFCGTAKPMLLVADAEQARAVQIGRTVQLAAHYAPWRADCYPQAIIARLLLGIYRLPFNICMGLRRDSATGGAQAHAWVQCGKVCVTGGNGDIEYSVVGVFSSRDRDSRPR